MGQRMRRVHLRQMGLHLWVGSTLAGLGCGTDTTASAPGSLAITTSTSGAEPDPDGYSVAAGGVESAIATNGTTELHNLEPGTHSIQLSGIAPNCSVDGENPRPVIISAGEQASTTFSVLCPLRSPYLATDLGALPGGQFSSARDINSAGQVVGISEYPIVLGGSQPFIWESGVMTAILPSDLETYVGEANAINPSGQVAGVIRPSSSRSTLPYLWEQGVLNRLPIPVPPAYAYDINPAGQVVGWGCFPSNELGLPCHAALWQDGEITDLGTLDGESSTAYGIDPAGRVVGESDGHAFLWEDGVMTNLNIPGGRSVGFRINAAGQVIGLVIVGSVNHGFIWKDGVTTDIGEVFQVSDINSAGQVVGWRQVEGTDYAFIWENGIMTDLPGPSRAFGINDEGQIVGDAGLGQSENGFRPSRATLWTHR
jgi:probable HAF family extracellular repeat protein